MIKKRILSGILGACVLLSATTAFAGFSDVDNDPTVSWAKPYIEEMTSLGYIKGYEDGTFKPNKTISKVESLVLLSRMIGVEDEKYSGTLEYALSCYKDVIEKYSSEYENEIAFLLYRGVLKEEEVANYISISNRGVALKRYEAAVLLTKLLGGEKEVENSAFVSSSYSDTLEIPDSARAYVEYVKEAGIMQGMGSNENGPFFSPNTGVTRSQMAKMLCSLIDVLDCSSETGEIVSVDNMNDSFTVTINNYDIVIPMADATKIKLGGKDAKLADLEKGMTVRISYLNGNASLIEDVVIIKDAEIKGVVASVRESGNDTIITLADSDNTSKTTRYTVKNSVKVIVNGAIDSISKIKANNYVCLTIKDGEVTQIEIINKTEKVSGTLKRLDISGSSTVFEIEKTAGGTESYTASADGVSVSRNNLDSTLAQLIAGDAVTLTLNYGKVTKVVAESSTENSTGVIEYITHSADGTVVGIKLNNKVTEYKINKNATILIDSLESGVYELRPGGDVKIKLESNEIVKLETASVAVNSQLTGTVKSVNATYGLIIVEYAGKEYNIFTNSNTKVIDSKTGNTMKIKSLEKGDSLAITGTNASGVFEATVIVVQ